MAYDAAGRYYAEAKVKPSLQKEIDAKREAAEKDAKVDAKVENVRDDAAPTYTVPEAAKAEKKPAK